MSCRANPAELSPIVLSFYHFSKQRTVNPDPVLLLNGTPIAVVEQVKFLGLIFDKHLSFISHLRYLKQKCLKALNLLRVVSSTKWGTDEKTLLHLYRVLIRSKLDLHFKCWIQYRIILFAFALGHFEHPQSQAYTWKQMRCLWN